MQAGCWSWKITKRNAGHQPNPSQRRIYRYTAENADKAMGYIDENIDVVLSDLHMGDVSGIDLLNLWKKKRPDTQFILLTGPQQH